MSVIIISSLVALLFTFLESKAKLKGGMAFGFLIVTVIAAIHYNYGNDYFVYYSLYEDIVSTPFNYKSIISGEIFKESGWVMLNYLFAFQGGFFILVAVLNIMQNIIVYRFVHRTVERKWWPFSVFIYLFTTCLYLYDFSMMRQGLTVCIFLGLWPFIRDKKWVVSVVALLLCSLIHSSALMLLPLSFLGFLPTNRPRVLGIIYISLFFVLWLSVTFLNGILETFLILDNIQKYYDYYSYTGTYKSLGIGYYLNILPLAVYLYLFFRGGKLSGNQYKLLFIGSLVYFVTPFTQIIPMISRFSVYFIIYEIGALPTAYKNVSKVFVRTGLLIVYITMTLYDYCRFFVDPIWSSAYGTFHTIFEVI